MPLPHRGCLPTLAIRPELTPAAWETPADPSPFSPCPTPLEPAEPLAALQACLTHLYRRAFALTVPTHAHGSQPPSLSVSAQWSPSPSSRPDHRTYTRSPVTPARASSFYPHRKTHRSPQFLVRGGSAPRAAHSHVWNENGSKHGARLFCSFPSLNPQGLDGTGHIRSGRLCQLNKSLQSWAGDSKLRSGDTPAANTAFSLRRMLQAGSREAGTPPLPAATGLGWSCVYAELQPPPPQARQTLRFNPPSRQLLPCPGPSGMSHHQHADVLGASGTGVPSSLPPPVTGVLLQHARNRTSSPGFCSWKADWSVGNPARPPGQPHRPR